MDTGNWIYDWTFTVFRAKNEYEEILSPLKKPIDLSEEVFDTVK